MAASATTATLLCPLRGGVAGDRDIVIQWELSAPVENEQLVTLLQNGTTTIDVPSTCTLIIVIPPTDNPQFIKIDDNSGKKIGQTIPTVIPAEGETSIDLFLESGSNQTVRVLCV